MNEELIQSLPEQDETDISTPYIPDPSVKTFEELLAWTKNLSLIEQPEKITVIFYGSNILNDEKVINFFLDHPDQTGIEIKRENLIVMNCDRSQNYEVHKNLTTIVRFAFNETEMNVRERKWLSEKCQYMNEKARKQGLFPKLIKVNIDSSLGEV